MRDVKERFEALADQGEPLGAVEVMRRARRSVEDGRHRPHRHRRVLVPLAAAAAVVALAIGTVALVTRSDDEGPSVVAGGGEPPSDETLFLVPSFVPEGFELIEASGGDQPGASAGGGGGGADGQQHYVRFDAAHEHPVEILDIQWGATLPDGLDDPADIAPQAAPVTVRGHNGFYSSEMGSLAWEEPEGELVNIQGTVARENAEVQVYTSLPLDFLITVAETLEPRDGGGFELPDPPGGFELVAEGPGEYSDGTNPRTLAYRGADGRGLSLNLVDDSERPPGLSLYYATDRLVDVRGRQGVLTGTRGTLAPGSFDQETLFISTGADLHVQWVEPGNVQVTMSGVGLSDSELLAIAEGLEPVDADTWFGLRGETQAGDPRLTPPSQLRVLVLNAGALPGSASATTNSLRAAGYNVLPAAETPLLRTGWAVQCRSTFESAAAALASAVSTTGRVAGVEEFDDLAAAEFPDADCIVYLGE